MKSQDTRVSELEKQKNGGAVVYAVHYVVSADEDTTVEVNGSGEVLTVEEFNYKYPDGCIIHVIYEEIYPAESYH